MGKKSVEKSCGSLPSVTRPQMVSCMKGTCGKKDHRVRVMAGSVNLDNSGPEEQRPEKDPNDRETPPVYLDTEMRDLHTAMPF